MINKRLDGVLAVSRSIGDFGIKYAKFNRTSSSSSLSQTVMNTAAVSLRTPGFGGKTSLVRHISSSDGNADVPVWAGRRRSAAASSLSFDESSNRPSPLDLLISTLSTSEEEDEDEDGDSDDSDGGLALSPYFSHKEWTRENARGNFPLAEEALKMLRSSTRRLGSFSHHENSKNENQETALSSVPDIVSVPLVTPTRRLICVVAASDGLWDVLSNEEATSLAHQLLCSGVDPVGVADRLVREARSRGSNDDITAIVVDIREDAEKAEFE